MCVETCGSTCVSGLSPLALTVRVYTRWHPLTCCTICAHSGDTVSSLTLCVYKRDTQYAWPPCRHCMQRRTLLPSFTIETRHVHIPSSLPLSQSGAFCLLVVSGPWLSLRTGVRSSRQAGCTISFSSWQCLWSGGFWKHDNNKKNVLLAAVRGCMLAVFVRDIFMYASWKLNKNILLDWWYGNSGLL